ncbi:MAG: hypothetical protein ABJ308_18950 [Halieaceae bacterium]
MIVLITGAACVDAVVEREGRIDVLVNCVNAMIIGSAEETTLAEKIHKLLMSDRKPLRVPMDKARAVALLKRFAPQSMINKLVNGLVAAG